MPFRPFDLDRRAFFTLTLTGAAAASFGASPLRAQSRAETLILVQERLPQVAIAARHSCL